MSLTIHQRQALAYLDRPTAWYQVPAGPWSLHTWRALDRRGLVELDEYWRDGYLCRVRLTDAGAELLQAGRVPA